MPKQLQDSIVSPGVGSTLSGSDSTAATQAGLGDLSEVRLHKDDAATHVASSFGAKAVTVDQDIYFNSGAHDSSIEGTTLLGHELTHAAQNRDSSRVGAAAKFEVSSARDEGESEADSGGSAFANAAFGAEVTPITISEEASSIALDEDTPTQKGLLDPGQAAAAIQFNRDRGLGEDAWAMICAVVATAQLGVSADMVERIGNLPNAKAVASKAYFTLQMVQVIAAVQNAHHFETNGCINDQTLQRFSQLPGGAGLEQHVASDQVVYVGMNPTSRGVESSALNNSAGSKNVSNVLGSDQQGTAVVNNQSVLLADTEGFDAYVSQFELLESTQTDSLREFFKTNNEMATDELAQLCTLLYEAEFGQRLIKRVVLSGHSDGACLWGDSDGLFYYKTLTQLLTVFPMALGQVEDLCLSACHTGWQSNLPTYLEVFPNLKSIWAYAGYSPTGSSGAAQHITKWEEGTRGPMDHDKINESRENVGAGGGLRDKNVAVWTRENGAVEGQYETAHPTAEFSEVQSRYDDDMASYFVPAIAEGSIDQTGLNSLYSTIQILLGEYPDRLDNPEEMDDRRLQVLYLRHWDKIVSHFISEHGVAVREAYGSQPIPQFDGASRVDVLRFEDEFSGDRSSEGYSLFIQLLINLEPGSIPENWM